MWMLVAAMAVVVQPMAARATDAAFAQDDRPVADYAQHETRKAREVLAFTGIGPGMTVIDMEAGGGLYTEIFAKTVGAGGRVYMQNPPLFDNFAGDAIRARVADDRLANVVLMRTAFDTLPVADASVDVVTWFLGPHELWYHPEGYAPGVLGDPDRAFTEIARVLRPGGYFVALDHRAAPGTPSASGGQTHRIDEAIVVEHAAASGLRLAATSTLLAHPEDDLTKNVFDPSVRRQTDRFLLKFVRD